MGLQDESEIDTILRWKVFVINYSGKVSATENSQLIA